MLTASERSRIHSRLLAIRYPHGRIAFRLSGRQSNLFGTCKLCGGFTIRGICQKCGASRVCSWCTKIAQPDGSWIHVQKSPAADTHGICPSCLDAQLQLFATSVQLKRDMRRAELFHTCTIAA